MSQSLEPSQIEDIRLATSKMQGANRRAFQAEMALKYCRGSARLSETVFGWQRETVALGLAEKNSGITCVGAQVLSGRKPWEECQPEAAAALRQLAESQAQQDPTFQSSMVYTRLTAAKALKQLKEQGFTEEHLPAASTMSELLNRMGYRLRKVLKAKPKKKFPKLRQFSRISRPKTPLASQAKSSA